VRVLKPLGIDAAVKAREGSTSKRDVRGSTTSSRRPLAQARNEAAHARRQYDAVDPANRLVAGELGVAGTVTEEKRVRPSSTALRKSTTSPKVRNRSRAPTTFSAPAGTGVTTAANGIGSAITIERVPRIEDSGRAADTDLLVADTPGWADALTLSLAQAGSSP
jgi:hypothetical protein